ncbi:MAG: SDR family NAD(P)-dependent oxidoreductase [Candidatus Micrarchaeota archaeon]
MKVLVTGGAGFLGRWLAKRLLDEGHKVIAFDNLSNGSRENISEFSGNDNFSFIEGDVLDVPKLASVFDGVGLCIHAAAQINVQESLDHPERAVQSNVIGTYNVLEECRKRNAKVVLIGTCMVYDLASGAAISEESPVKPLSPYAASKLGAEDLALSYYHGYKLPVVVTRPFNIYGPFQKSNMEGGVVNIFIKRNLDGQELNIFGDGTQTRDLLYVEDCADFIVKAAFSEKAVGQIINAGTGHDITINELALAIAGDESKIRHIEHHHPQAEIAKLLCDSTKAGQMLGWKAETSLEEGIRITTEWMKSNERR